MEMLRFGTLGTAIDATATDLDLSNDPFSWLAVGDVVAIGGEHVRVRGEAPAGVWVERGFGPFSAPVTPHPAGTTVVVVGRWHR